MGGLVAEVWWTHCFWKNPWGVVVRTMPNQGAGFLQRPEHPAAMPCPEALLERMVQFGSSINRKIVFGSGDSRGRGGRLKLVIRLQTNTCEYIAWWYGSQQRRRGDGGEIGAP